VLPILVTCEVGSNVTDVNPVQPENVEKLPALVTELGMDIDVKAPQPPNALLPMRVTDSGMVIDAKAPQPLNAVKSMIVTCEVGSNVTDVNPEHCWNARGLMVVTELGMVTDIKADSWNAETPILVTELGMIIDVKLVH
jgi:hypothetical protein